jgi:hypothetical protein
MIKRRPLDCQGENRKNGTLLPCLLSVSPADGELPKTIFTKDVGLVISADEAFPLRKAARHECG